MLVTTDGGMSFRSSPSDVPRPRAPRVDALPLDADTPGLPVKGPLVLHDFGTVGGGTTGIVSKTSTVWELGECELTVRLSERVYV